MAHRFVAPDLRFDVDLELAARVCTPGLGREIVRVELPRELINCKNLVMVRTWRNCCAVQIGSAVVEEAIGESEAYAGWMN